MKLTESFYHQPDVVKLARDLVGKVLVTSIKGKRTSGIIVETEAYSWREKGCHAYNNRRTGRNEVMFSTGGIAYVYVCYGIHHLFNVVTNVEDVAEAVLVRALEPVEGVERMMKRMKVNKPNRISSGPGKLTKAMGIDRNMNGQSLESSELWIEDTGTVFERKKIVVSQRIGIDYAGRDAQLPWRFSLKDNSWVSK